MIWSWKEQSYNNMTCRSPPFEEVLNPVHAWFHTIGSALVLGLAFLHLVLVFVEERFSFRVLLPKNDIPVFFNGPGSEFFFQRKIFQYSLMVLVQSSSSKE